MDYSEKGNVSGKTLDMDRARQSLIEELQAIMWYDERADATTDEDLRSVLKHNRDDEKEHASLLLEWLRRQDPKIDEKLKAILFADKKFDELWD
ncbi:Uncharacterised protein [uncultured archaeon]|nr:Uncharacterised protein [uncultured archaeon]